MKNMNQKILCLFYTGIFLFSSILVYSYINPTKASSAPIPNMIQNGAFTQWTSNSSTSPITYNPLYWETVHANYTQSNAAGLNGQPVVIWNITTPDVSQNYGGCNLNGNNNGYGDIEGTDNFSCGIYQGNLGQLSSYTNLSLDWDITINAFNANYFPSTTPIIAIGLSIDNNNNTGYIQPARPFPFSVYDDPNANLISPSGAYEVDYVWHTTCVDPMVTNPYQHFAYYQSVLYGNNFMDVKDYDILEPSPSGPSSFAIPNVPIGTSVHYKISIDVPNGIIQYFYNNTRIYAVQDTNIYTGNIFVEAFDYGVSEYTISNITLTANTPSVAEYNPPVTVLTVMIPLVVVAAYVRRRKPHSARLLSFRNYLFSIPARTNLRE